MDNIEQLKQDNEKLKERLNNAAKFFREQKATIENLNEQIKDKDVEITNQKDALQSCRTQLHDYEMMNDSLNKEKENLQKQSESLNEECQKLNIQCNEYELKLQKIESDINSKDKAYKLLQDTYNEVFANCNKLKEANTGLTEENKKLTALGIDYVNQINDYKKSLEDINLDYNKLQKEHDILNKTYNKLNNEYSDVYTKYNDLQQEQIKANEKLNALNTLCAKTKEDNKALQDKFDNLEKICNDFENQKLAAESDYQGMLDMYQELQKEYERLRNERDAYSQSDDALAEIAKVLIEKGFVNKNDLTPQAGIKESGTAHRMGDSLEGGKNVGV